jgi:hypothetical protein
MKKGTIHHAAWGISSFAFFEERTGKKREKQTMQGPFSLQPSA